MSFNSNLKREHQKASLHADETQARTDTILDVSRLDILFDSASKLIDQFYLLVP